MLSKKKHQRLAKNKFTQDSSFKLRPARRMAESGLHGPAFQYTRPAKASATTC